MRSGVCLADFPMVAASRVQPSKRITSHPDLETVLFTERQIKRRVRGLAAEIKRVYGKGEFTLVSLINGAVMFTADLMREIDNPVRLDCIRTTRYGNATESRGIPKLVHGLTLDITGRHVLIVDDILDTGKTLSLITSMIRGLNPASVRGGGLRDK